MLLKQRVLLGLGQVVGAHFFAHFLCGDFGHPSEFSLGLGRVAEKGFDFGRAEVAGVNAEEMGRADSRFKTPNSR